MLETTRANIICILTTYVHIHMPKFLWHQRKICLYKTKKEEGKIYKSKTIFTSSNNRKKIMKRPSYCLLISVLVSFLSVTSKALEYRYHICANTTTFTANSTYQSNLNRLLSSFTSNATLDSGYYNATIGQNPASTVYGSLLCRGDVTPDDCRSCAVTAVRDVAQRKCPVEKVAVIWYDKCTLRYSDQSFFGNLDETTIMMYNTQNITDPERFTTLLSSTMNELVDAAAGAPSGEKKFATKEVRVSGFQTLYSLVQCTPDLSNSDCDQCIQGNIALLPTCCNGKRGGNVFNPSCNVRYEVYPFYRITASAPSPVPVVLPPPPTKSAIRSRGKKHIKKQNTLVFALRMNE